MNLLLSIDRIRASVSINRNGKEFVFVRACETENNLIWIRWKEGKKAPKKKLFVWRMHNSKRRQSYNIDWQFSKEKLLWSHMELIMVWQRQTINPFAIETQWIWTCIWQGKKTVQLTWKKQKRRIKYNTRIFVNQYDTPKHTYSHEKKKKETQ